MPRRRRRPAAAILKRSGGLKRFFRAVRKVWERPAGRKRRGGPRPGRSCPRWVEPFAAPRCGTAWRSGSDVDALTEGVRGRWAGALLAGGSLWAASRGAGGKAQDKTEDRRP